MLTAYPRTLLSIVGAMLLTPMLAGLVTKPASRVAHDEFRMLVAAPAFPRSLPDWKKLPSNIDSYLRDNFGFRDTMISQHIYFEQRLFGAKGNENVLRGNDGWLFYRGNEMLSQSSGKLVRKDLLEATATTIEEMNRALMQRGAKLIVAPAPNAATIYSDKISGWPDLSNKSTEYDLLIEDIQRRGIPFVDLRIVLKEAKASARVYLQHDTHWNPRGAVIAFNTISAAVGHADWRLDPAQVLAQPTFVGGGDLARFLGISSNISETIEKLSLAEPAVADIPDLPGAFETKQAKAGNEPTVLIFGDSFTYNLFPSLLTANHVHLIFVPFRSCNFNWRRIEELLPDEIWVLPTERFMLCGKRSHPTGLPPLSRTR